MFKTVILDGYTVNPGDLSWDIFKEFSSLEVYPRCTPEEKIERTAKADGIYVNKLRITREDMERAESLKFIGVLATGCNNIDLAAARELNITVTNIPGYSTDSVAQHAFALLLALARAPETHGEAVRRGKWSSNPDFTFQVTPQVELAEKTLGIIGFGKIGRAAGAIGNAMKMKITAAAPRPKDTPSYPEFRWVSQEELFRESDAVTLHCPLTEETEHIVNARTLGMMKKSAFLINTGRGGLIDEPALAEVLHTEGIAGAGLDVLSEEPPRDDHPLLKAPRCIITPHTAWTTREARQRMIGIAAENLRQYLRGNPVNVVS
jgi:glycerate dehydrogenase